MLYAVMGISAYLVHSADAPEDKKRSALRVYWAQLAVNFSWSIVFFRFEAFWGAFAVILLLLALIIAMLVSFGRVRRLAAYINIPYLLWVMFAAYLNLSVAILN